MSGARDETILLTGATGYVGGRLLRRLAARGCRVRCLTRRPESLAGRVGPGVEAVAGDLQEPESLGPAFAGVDCAYYLAHSLASGRDFEQEEYAAARNFAAAARAAGVRRIIYLGGLGDDAEDLSPHLKSRHEVGRILRASGALVIEFRASIIIGSGSLSFEIIRALVRKLPVMITPRWVHVPAQPIAINDVLAYLAEAIDVPLEESAIFEIGGADQTSYAGLMREYARQRGLRRLLIAAPVLSPGLSSLWLKLVTPVYASIGRKLVDSMRHPTVVRDQRALEVFRVRPASVSTAIAQALRKEDQEFAETHWAGALSSVRMPAWGPAQFGSRMIDARAVRVRVPPAQAFAPIRRIGGRKGWYYGNWLWRLRGLLDLLWGGVGGGRGRRDAEALRVGDVVGFWRVEALEPDRRLRLRAEMKLPGRAWLEFQVEPDGEGAAIQQTAIFDPAGLLGLSYWYSTYVLHGFIFPGMLRRIAFAAEGGLPGPRPKVIAGPLAAAAGCGGNDPVSGRGA